MEQATGALAVVLIGGLAVACSIAGMQNCRRHLDEWARDNGLRLVSVTRRWMTFAWFWRSRSQRIYEIEVEDAQGETRVGLAKVGGYFWGALSSRVEVRWF